MSGKYSEDLILDDGRVDREAIVHLMLELNAELVEKILDGRIYDATNEDLRRKQINDAIANLEKVLDAQLSGDLETVYEFIEEHVEGDGDLEDSDYKLGDGDELW